MSNLETSGHDQAADAAGAQGEDSRLLTAIRQQLDHNCAALDGQTLSRLHRIRSAAIERRQSSWQRVWLSFGGLAAACMLVLVIGVGKLQGGHGADGNFDAVENIEIISSQENLDLYENYEFYQWLAQD